MSATALITRRGSRASIYRGTPATAADGNRSLGAPWTLQSSNVAILLQPVGDSMAQKAFGTDLVVRDRGFVASAVTLDPELDRIVVTSGPRLGQKYRVVESQPWQHRTVADHHDLALEATTEVFP